MVAVDTMGELHFRGFSVLMYYWGDEEKTKEAKDDNGWLHTGDLAKMDAAGYITMLGRIKDIIIKEAVSLSPLELEIVLYQHQEIAGAVVTGVPDDRTGEEICAFIILQDGSKVTEDDVKEFCRGKVYALLMPKYVILVDQFPTTETGKFSRRSLTEIAIEKLHL
ncbi:medium-chain acyl-CoA ligase ACSF2, mitochondrial-like [Amphiura filiformis]|uniref:medium-chain acyl-CoA ligase ACSF2, mitochondrial-like n=1 Tax=Amphiura filiformis TaxID=82378 RepID=UPI003B21FD95